MYACIYMMSHVLLRQVAYSLAIEDVNLISVTSHKRRVLVGYPERRNSTQRYRE